MSVPWVIIGLGAVGGLWVAKAGPFAPATPAAPALAHESPAPAADGYAQPTAEHEPTHEGEAMPGIATAPPEAPTVHQVDTNLQAAANTVQVATDSLGVQGTVQLTDGTKTGGTQRMGEDISIELPPQTSVEDTVFGGSRGLTPRDIGRATSEYGGMMGMYW